MSAYSEVQDRINSDYLNRTTFGAETKRAIQAAIRHYERRRWNFNETSTALTAASSIGYVALPSNFLVLDDLRITIDGSGLDMIREDPQTIRDMNTAPTFGQPTHYALYQNRVNFFPVPDSAYSTPLYYIKSLSVLSADTDTNAWIQGGMEDVIVYHATKLMWANVVRNDAEALKFAQLEADAVNAIVSHHEQYRNTRLKATRF